MKSCDICKKSIPDDSDYCPFCGSKIASHKEECNQSVEQPLLYQPSALLTRAFLFIEDELFDKANDFLETVLNIEPENAQAYLGKLMIELRVKCKADLINCNKSFDSSKNYQKLVRFQ